MHKNNLVTVLMSVRNGEPYIKEAVSSILNQTYDKFNFLILDNASTDNTRSIIKELKDSRIKLVELSQDIGQSSALNKGLGIINTKYVARMDADDISLNKRLEKQVKYLESHSNVGVLGCHVKIVNQDLTLSKPVRKRPLTNYENQWRLLYSTSIMHSSAMFQRSLFLKYGGYNVKYSPAEDYEMWSRLSEYTEIHQLPNILVLIRNHELRSSVKKKSQQMVLKNKICKKNINRLLSNHVNSKKIDDLTQYISGRREGSKQWWRNILYTMVKMYTQFNQGKLLTKKEIKWINKDLIEHCIDVPNKYKLILIKQFFNEGRLNCYNKYKLFKLINKSLLATILRKVQLS